MKKLLFAAAALLTLLPAASYSQVEDNTIYGRDDRIDLYQVESSKVRKLADSTIALFQASDVSLQGGVAKLSLQPYGAGMGLCKDEPFWDQKNGAFCSGSLVAPDVIMTAGHCVTDQDSCVGTKFVFGFDITDKDKGTPDSLPADNVYGCSKLLGREQIDDGADWALVKLDRPVAGRQPLRLNATGKITKGTPLFVIGHPAGLPTKVAGGAAVRDDSHAGFIVANLDTYGGNSGSAVFNAKTGLVEGVLVRGENDYVWRDGGKDGESCRVSNRCPDDGCRGEDVTRIANVIAHMPGASVASRAPARVVPIGAAVEQALRRYADKAPSFDGTGGR